MITILRALIMLLPVLICGCGDKHSTQVRLMKKADVQAEVTDALARGDHRFVGIMGYSLVVPGLTNFPTTRDDLKLVRTVPNTSDIVLNRGHDHLQDVAFDYAARYNLELLKRLEEKTNANKATQAIGVSTSQPGR